MGGSPAEREADPSVCRLVNEGGQFLVRVVLQLRQVLSCHIAQDRTGRQAPTWIHR